MDIRVDDVTDPRVIALLREHLRLAAVNCPPCSVHALGVEALRQPGITFWTVWQGDDLMGCGAIKELDARHGEIKSMRTAAAHLRKGVAARVMQHIIDEARRRAYRRLSLETGSSEVYVPARALYSRFGFEVCGPFGEYVLDANSVFMTREL